MSLDIEDPVALADYLRRSGRIEAGQAPRVTILAGGVSNRTVLVERPSEIGTDWVIKQALAKLRVAVDWSCDPSRIHREAQGLRRLEELLPQGSVPRFVFEDHEHDLLAMEAVPRPHENWKTCLLAGHIDLSHVTQFAGLLAAIHRGSRERRDELAAEFADRSYFESLRLEPYYAYTAAHVPEASGFLAELIDVTRHQSQTLVHGDFSPKNILVFERRLVLLDHEVIHWGDPAFDMGFGMAHLLSKAHHLESFRAAFIAAAHTFWNHYAAEIDAGSWQDDLPGRGVRHTLGCLLARVAGRSPLEYLSEVERARQQRMVLQLISDKPSTMDELIRGFAERLDFLAGD